MIQLANSSISPILTLFIRELSGNVSNIAFVSGMIAAVPGIAALISAPRLGRLGDRIGTARILIAALLFTTGLFAVMAGLIRRCSWAFCASCSASPTAR